MSIIATYQDKKLVSTPNKPTKVFKKAKEAFPLPPIAGLFSNSYLAVDLVDIASSGRKLLRVSQKGQLPVLENATYFLNYCFWQGSIEPTSKNWVAVRLDASATRPFVHSLEANPSSTYLLYLSSIVAGKTVAYQSVNVSTPTDTTYQTIEAITSDDVLSRSEKPSLIKDYQEILAEQTNLDATATQYGITTEKNGYDNAISALAGFISGLNPSYASLTTDTPLGTGGGLSLRNLFVAIANTKAALQKKIDGITKTTIDDIYSDNVLTPPEKVGVKREYDSLQVQASGDAGLIPLATAMGVSHGALDTAVSNLDSYLASISGWNGSSHDWTDYTSNVSISGSVLRARIISVEMAILNLRTAINNTPLYRSVLALDGDSTAGFTIYRGNIDTTVRNGTPNIDCLSVNAYGSGTVSDWQTCYWGYQIQPTTYSAKSDNLDCLRYLRVRLYTNASSSSPFADFNVQLSERTYDGATGATRGTFSHAWRSNVCEVSQQFSGYIRCEVVNVYGSSASKDFGPVTSNGALPSGTITGQAGSSSGGSGPIGGPKHISIPIISTE